MSELKRHHINEVMDMHALTRGELGYSQVYYADDVDGVIAKLKARIHELENMPHTDNSAVIELLENENAQLKESRQAWIARSGVAEENLAKLEKELAEIREATRWRKCSEELPDEEQFVLAWLTEDGKRGFFLTSCFIGGKFLIGEDPHGCKPTYWMPLPSAPKEEK